jgi:ATP-binding cassette subfamily B protein
MFFMLGTIMVTMIQVFLELKLPDYMNAITTTVITPGSPMSEIWKAGGMMLLCSFGGLVASVLVGLFCAKVATGFSMRLRSKVYDKVTGFSMEEINGFSTASLITRSTNDIMHVQMFLVMGTAIMFRAVIMASMWFKAFGDTTYFELLSPFIVGAFAGEKVRKFYFWLRR